MIDVIINGEARQLEREMTISELTEYLSLAENRMAIEVNRKIIRKNDWKDVSVAEKDIIEIVYLVGGG